MQQQTAETALVLAPGEQPCCKDPSQKATHAYFWDWGESGFVCAEQAAILQQQAPQLGRTVQITPLPPTGPVEPTRDERIGWFALQKTLELELEDAKSKGLELWRNNEQLRKENQLHVTRKASADLEREQLLETIGKLEQANAELGRENAELLNKLERAQTLAAFAPRGAELGLGNVVDGER